MKVAANAVSDYCLKTMNKLILLDAGPLGLLANPHQSPAADACNQWMQQRLQAGTVALISEVADYEVRRELIRAGRTASLRKLDSLQQRFTFLPITSPTMRRAAELWALSRQMGKPTSHELSLDGDVIIAAQAALLRDDGDDIIVATTNPRHFVHLVPAANWQDIA